MPMLTRSLRRPDRDRARSSAALSAVSSWRFALRTYAYAVLSGDWGQVATWHNRRRRLFLAAGAATGGPVWDEATALAARSGNRIGLATSLVLSAIALAWIVDNCPSHGGSWNSVTRFVFSALGTLGGAAATGYLGHRLGRTISHACAALPPLARRRCAAGEGFLGGVATGFLVGSLEAMVVLAPFLWLGLERPLARWVMPVMAAGLAGGAVGAVVGGLSGILVGAAVTRASASAAASSTAKALPTADAATAEGASAELAALLTLDRTPAGDPDSAPGE
ncbi:MAG: hypothetical protein HYV63_26890 [Candidatus Schekmanbacteria bacterium]|nr:hypothetical protein [Candidatus Schekmanbacteria bacterium]